MKSYTDLPQSKKLAEFLSHESADMCFVNDGTSIKIDANSFTVGKEMWKDIFVEIIPCWSLAALFDILPKQFDEYVKTLYWSDGAYHCSYENESWESKYWMSADNLIDACFKMILKLHEYKLL